jgi:hypothetical protein
MTTSTKALVCTMTITAAALLPACNDTASTVVVTNAYPADAEGGAPAAMTVVKLWWMTTLIADPVAPATTSAAERAAPGDDFAYALLAPGWGAPPDALIAARSRERLSVARGEQLRIAVSDDTFIGNCAAGRPLDADTATLIVERIFPGDFAGATYDPSTCVTTPASADAGSD